MKNLKLVNSIAIAIPIIFLLYGFIDGTGFYLSAYSMIITGFLQLIIGIIFWMKFKNDLNIKIYFTVALLFFSLWYFNENIFYLDELTWPLISTPPILAIYLSILIYKKANK
ncbi:hypothetical protein C8C85_2352 [Flavobacterium sp. 103]|uniref:hypothetical protein n=1 Tax=Flavobacterium sp. 103 TaxID=2135624 RepID=UPI000D5F9CEC|nr:hypothetical protein [Flavobacterium sp. 103]PVX46490.1 hypothetical protein C8C85_2352 [Flavobacterium sp. 103]